MRSDWLFYEGEELSREFMNSILYKMLFASSTPEFHQRRTPPQEIEHHGSLSTFL